VSDLSDMNEHIERLSKRIGTLNELHAAYAARTLIINRAKVNADLLALAHQYAEECGDCAGTRVCPDDEPCTACADVWAVIDKAEGRA
jgi:hypothetical protein